MSKLKINEFLDEEEKPLRLTAIIYIDDDFHSIDYFRDKYPTAELESINGLNVIGKCIGCGGILLDGDDTVDCTDEVGCTNCFPPPSE